MKTIDLEDLCSVQGGIARGPAVGTWGQLGPGVRAKLHSDGTLRLTVPKTEIHKFPNGSLHGITRRGEFVLQPKAPYGH
jgi:hypothetical protein